MNYYTILEVQRSASTDDIKKAYRRLALKWHPDKNPDNLEEANKRFKEITEAYEVLSDERKRRMYDQYGKRRHEDDYASGYTGTFVFREPEEVFREFFRIHIPESYKKNSSGFYRHSHPGSNNISTSFIDPFGFSPINMFFEGGADNSFTSFNMFASMGATSADSGGAVRKTSTSTRFINGKKITTKKIQENGKVTIMSYENDVLKSKTVDGVPQSITFDEASTSRQVTDNGSDVAMTSQNSKTVHCDHLKPSKTNHHHLPFTKKHTDKGKGK